MISIYVVHAGHGDITVIFNVACNSVAEAKKIVQAHLQADSWQEIEREELGWLRDVEEDATAGNTRYEIFDVSEAERNEDGAFVGVDTTLLTRPGELQQVAP